MLRYVLLLVMLVSACGLSPRGSGFITAEQWNPSTPELQQKASDFRQVSRAVSVAATDTCRRQAKNLNCEFGILVDPDPNAEVNAFQTLDDKKRPYIIFTQTMIESTQNADEMAFVMGHEAAHHVLDHIARQAKNSQESAQIFGNLARDYGADDEGVELAQKLGADVGVQVYIKGFELEADRLGTVITHSAGYDPLVGMEYFKRIPDPGDRFLATHPPNAQRVQAVLETAAQLGLTQ
ncbi:M48 family metallopeptidase [Roseibium sp. RKSG952]|uniref:M48 family metallopeptidase n=1 Tax=Roseibium sp. RKSG952 TaxID=2529384 RepID=UPI0012BB7721|nr:M48 family metallopeptidase [Roseibium sp. RKSG952]MTI00781.1 peptidase M48 [Roseibium sp. RKSG952]